MRFLLSIIIFIATSLCAFSQPIELMPQVGNPYWTDSIPASMRRSYISYGEQYLGKSWTVLPWTVFAENKITGNRVNYEAICFEKRRQLAALVMAEIMENEGRFMPDIINGLGAFCEETWWGIPAHYGKRIPLTNNQEVDLFNAETANLIVWSAYMLRPQLDKFSPDVWTRIKTEIKHRILEPALQRNYWWKTAGMNWNPWICSNWLSCVLLCEDNAEQKQQAIDQIKKATQAFIDAYPEDGGCDEGPGYWDRAAASMFETLYWLKQVGIDVPITNKMRNMAAYVYKTYIGNDYCVNFADAHDNRTLQQVNIVYPFGLFLGDKSMCQFAAYIGKQKDILNNAAKLYDKSGNFPTLSRELMLLRHINIYKNELPIEPHQPDVWLPNLQIMTARRGNLFVAMKGGTNGESHNHNDVGSFIVYTHNEPLLIDVGVGEYTAKTFSSSRYDIWTMQSDYHNLPKINGVSEKDGKQFAAKVLDHGNGKLTLDIAAAYPEEAKVKSWLRSLSVNRKGISITEKYELAEYQQPSQLMFITTTKPEVAVGKVMLGEHSISFDAQQMTAEIEDISHLLDPLLQGVWGKNMYRIKLIINSKANKNTIKYNIR
ncbi:MAG: heparinase II/III-family protein [Marinilabiliaceae bacterium]|nr:heparinase II/III-family protein [Marinilabiliaceae bacterium]